MITVIGHWVKVSPKTCCPSRFHSSVSLSLSLPMANLLYHEKHSNHRHETDFESLNRLHTCVGELENWTLLDFVHDFLTRLRTTLVRNLISL